MGNCGGQDASYTQKNERNIDDQLVEELFESRTPVTKVNVILIKLLARLVLSVVIWRIWTIYQLLMRS